MTRSYRVAFYRELVGGMGKPYDSELYAIRIKGCDSEQAAAEEAIKKFQKRNKLAHWSHLATKYEVSAVG